MLDRDQAAIGRQRRSYLYVSGQHTTRFIDAEASGADAVIFDLEDSVPPDLKAAARAAISTHTPESEIDLDIERWVRVNSGPHAAADLAMCRELPWLTGVVIPKASADTLRVLDLPARVQVCALVESARAMRDIDEIVGCRPDLLAIGEADLGADLRMAPSADGDEMWPLRLSVIVACAAGSMQPPIGPVFLDVHNIDGLRASTIALRRGGFGARQVIHPKQVPAVNELMAPSDAELQHARDVLAILDNVGVAVDGAGMMIDEAVARQARLLLGHLERTGSTE